MICDLTGMDVTNASLYDGASAVAEAALMAARITRREELVVAGNVHPAYRQVLRTYTQGLGLPIREVGYDHQGRVDLASARETLSSASACLIVQHPNFFGCLEDLSSASELAHRFGALLGLLGPHRSGGFPPSR